MKIINLSLRIIIVIIIVGNFSCTKEFLEGKPNSSIIRPQSLEELQLLLENTGVFGVTSKLPLISSDELEFLSNDAWEATIYQTTKNAYVWKQDIYVGETSQSGWDDYYKAIFYANSVLDRLDDLHVTNTSLSKYYLVKGWALFCRANAYYELIKNFSPAFDESTSALALGVPLKLNPSIDDILPRATQQEIFDRVFLDLKSASVLLGSSLPLYRNQPSKIACFALSSRIYLNMRFYAKAEAYADSTLMLYNKLIDYNNVSVTNQNPFANIEDELLYHAIVTPTDNTVTAGTANSETKVPDKIIKLYDSNDLRLPIYFLKRLDGTYVRKRGYAKSGQYTATGLAIDEIYLIKSECSARRGDQSTSLKYINDLLAKRFKMGTYVPTTFTNQTDLLNKILEERQKELVWRGLRWDDIKRLNKEGANIVLKRVVSGLDYILLPNDPKYVFPIPDNELQRSNIPQNIR